MAGRVLTVALRRCEAAVCAARSQLVGALRRWRAPQEQIDDAALLVSEIVTNAVRHGAGSRIAVRVCYDDRVLSCRVIDGSPELPAPRQAHPDDESGRGLQLVAALASRWGSEPFPQRSGKAIWFELAR